MELATQQPPQSPRTVQVSQESAKPKLDLAYYEMQQTVNDTVEQLSKQRKTELSNAINSALSNHREEILNALNGRIDERCDTVKTQLLAKLKKQKLKIQQLSQKSQSFDSGTNFLKYCAIAGFLALIIGTVVNSTKIITIYNHFINQTIKS